MKTPIVDDITIEITNACNLHCQWCDIWQETERYQIAFPVIKRILDKSLLFFRLGSVSLTGGEPFLHPELERIVKCLALLRLKRRIVSFGVYSNGTCTERIERFLSQHRSLVQGMSLGVSVDGGAKCHDALRGPGAYEQTMKTLDILQREYADVCNVEIKFTADRANYRELFAVYQMAVSRGFRFTPKLVEKGVSAYYHRCRSIQGPGQMEIDGQLGQGVAGQLSLVLKEEMVRKKRSIDLTLTQMLLHLARKGAGEIKCCDTPSRDLFITSRGDVFPCLSMDPIGNANDDGFCSEEFFAKWSERRESASQGRCKRCWSYHGFLKEINSGNLKG